MKVVKVGIEVEVPDEVPGYVALQNVFRAAESSGYRVVQAYGLPDRDKEKDLLREERDEVAEYARKLEDRIALIVENVAGERPSTDAEKAECKRLGCAPGNWVRECPLHGKGA